jgi:hypothetical protein
VYSNISEHVPRDLVMRSHCAHYMGIVDEYACIETRAQLIARLLSHLIGLYC